MSSGPVFGKSLGTVVVVGATVVVVGATVVVVVGATVVVVVVGAIVVVVVGATVVVVVVVVVVGATVVVVVGATVVVVVAKKPYTVDGAAAPTAKTPNAIATHSDADRPAPISFCFINSPVLLVVPVATRSRQLLMQQQALRTLWFQPPFRVVP